MEVPDALEAGGRDDGTTTVHSRCAPAVGDVHGAVRVVRHQSGHGLQVAAARERERPGFPPGALAPAAFVSACHAADAAGPTARGAAPASDLGSPQAVGPDAPTGAPAGDRVCLAGAQHRGGAAPAQWTERAAAASGAAGPPGAPVDADDGAQRNLDGGLQGPIPVGRRQLLLSPHGPGWV